MAPARLRAKGQVTIPEEIREAARLEEGDPIAFELQNDGTILLRPQKVVDASQAWFWTPEWIAGERQASFEIDQGRITTFKTGDEFLDSLPD